MRHNFSVPVFFVAEPYIVLAAAEARALPVAYCNKFSSGRTVSGSTSALSKKSEGRDKTKPGGVRPCRLFTGFSVEVEVGMNGANLLLNSLIHAGVCMIWVFHIQMASLNS